MKLFYMDGKKAGEAYNLTPPGISIGREIDNDLILDCDGCSRYHSKLEWSDDVWKLKDLGSTNGTKLNGEKISSTQTLKEGDKIKIGTQSLLFAESVPKEIPQKSPEKTPTLEIKEDHKSHNTPTLSEIKQESIGKPEERSSFSDFFGKRSADGSFSPLDAKINIFGKKEKSAASPATADGQKKKSPIIFYAVVILSAIILLSMFVLIEKLYNDNSQKETTPQTQKNKGIPLMVMYEKQITTPDNIFRYELKISGDKISVTRDDLKCHVKFRREKQSSQEQIRELEEGIKNTDFMNLQQPQFGISADNTDETKKLTIAFGREVNSVTIKNTFEPTSFKEVVTQLEDFSKVVLNIPSIQLTAEEMTEEAQIAFDKAEQLFDNYQANDKNLTDAIIRYQIAIDMLENFEPKPAMYDKAFAKQQEARSLRLGELDAHNKNARRYELIKDFDKAKEEYRSIMNILEGEDNKMYKDARERIILFDKLKSGSKK